MLRDGEGNSSGAVGGLFIDGVGFQFHYWWNNEMICCI